VPVRHRPQPDQGRIEGAQLGALRGRIQPGRVIDQAQCPRHVIRGHHEAAVELAADVARGEPLHPDEHVDQPFVPGQPVQRGARPALG
jgi:hypothetical protein